MYSSEVNHYVLFVGLGADFFGLERNESRLEELSGGQVDELAKVAEVTRWQTTQNLVDLIQKKRVGTELWKYFAFIALALAAMETVLAHFFSKAK